MTQDTLQIAQHMGHRRRLRWHAPRLGALLIAALFALTLAALAAQPSQSAHPTNARASSAMSARGNEQAHAASGSTDLGAGQFPLALTPTATPASSATPTTTSTTTASSSSPGWGLPDPAQWAQQALAAVLSAFFSGALAALLRVLAWAQGLGARPSTSSPRHRLKAPMPAVPWSRCGPGWWASPTPRWRCW